MAATVASADVRSAASPRPAPPFSYFEWMVARRYLGATRTGKGVSLISIIAFVGIMLAVSVLIIVMSVMGGFRDKLISQLLGVNGHVFVQGEGPIEDFEGLAAKIKTVPGVVSATPLIQAPVYAMAGSESGMIIRGLNPEEVKSIDYVAGVDPETKRSHVLAGSFDTFGVGRNGGDEIALGSRLAYSLGVDAGDPVTLVSGRGADTPFGPTFGKKTYKVGAIFEVGNHEYDGFIGFMPLEQAQIFFRYGATAQQIEVRVTDPDNVRETAARIRAVVNDLPEAYYDVRDWQQQNQSYFNALQTERSVMRFILLLIILVAALNIISGLIMLVKDKTRDIAVMRTMGATQGSVMRIFFLSGSLIGVLGTLCGVVLGALFVINIDAIENFLSMVFQTDLFPEDIYYFKGVPANLEWKEVAFVSAASLLMSFLATLYPAWRAARLDPVDALRYE